jgi:hypothetical protein
VQLHTFEGCPIRFPLYSSFLVAVIASAHLACSQNMLLNAFRQDYVSIETMLPYSERPGWTALRSENPILG